jgi:Bacterial Ig domain
MKLNLFSILMAFSLAFISCSKDDTTGPVITITSPAEGSSLEKGKSHTVTGTVTDDTELAEIDLGGGSKITAFDSPTKHTLANVTFTIPATATSGSQGGITITAKDKAGNVSTKTATFTVK